MTERPKLDNAMSARNWVAPALAVALTVLALWGGALDGYFKYEDENTKACLGTAEWCDE